jgi:very-short-patch-repair endonuclease
MREAAKIKTARRLRRTMTKPETWLWVRLRARTNERIVFRKQHPVGPYVLDFYCAQARLAVEVDGEIHTRDAQRARDAVRDVWLTEQGIHVHRVIARDLLAAPDETAQGIFDLAFVRLAPTSPSHRI